MKHSMPQRKSMKYIEKPNLPQTCVRLAAISASAGEATKKLNELGIITIKIPLLATLPQGIASHADLQLLHLKENEFITCNEQLFDSLKIEKKPVIKAINAPTHAYPNDVPLNAAIVGNYIICNPVTVSKSVLEFAADNGHTIIPVSQGYSKCSVCILNESAIITDDISIYRAAQNFLSDVTYIEKNSIVLKGYNYGFIGGCSGKLSKNKIAFNGELSSHNDCNKIVDALQRNKLEAIELKSGVLEDIGSILPILEE